MKNINKFWILLSLINIFVAPKSFSQQDVMLTQYSSALQLTNPAYVGTSGSLNVTGIARNQWVGFEGAPKTQVLLINTPFLRHRFGIGLNLIRDEIGPTKNTLIYLNTAYNFQLTGEIRLSMGLSGGFNVNRMNSASFDQITINDPSVNFDNQMKLMPNFGTGVYLYSPTFYLGISTPKLLTNKFAGMDDINTRGEERHYFFIGGYLHEINNLWKFKPSFSLRMVKGAPISVDLTANAIYSDKVWFGLTYRHGDGAGAILQYQFTDRIRAGYSYDQPFTKMSHSGGSHEILISYDLIFKIRKLVTPRYF